MTNQKLIGKANDVGIRRLEKYVAALSTLQYLKMIPCHLYTARRYLQPLSNSLERMPQSKAASFRTTVRP